jgi:hypothetical protein
MTAHGRAGVQGCTPPRRRAIGDPEIGWIAAIIIGGIAGWLAEQFMKSDMGLLMNIALGVVGAAIPAPFSASLASSWADGSAT